MSDEDAKARYLFKITVVGPEDKLIERFMRIFHKPVFSIDGIQISSAGIETEDTDVKTVFMSPRHSALDLLFSMTYKGASGAIIILPKPDPKAEAKYRNEIRKNLGDKTPTRVIIGPISKKKNKELINILEDLITEILSTR